MSLFDRLYAAAYDRAVASVERAGLTRRRRDLLADVGGEVVELGAGTGANVGLYGPEVRHLTLLEPDAAMADRLRRRVAATAGPDTDVIEAPGEALPLADTSVDTVVSTLVLCTVTDLDRTLGEVERVLRPGGRLVLLEHVAASDPDVARLQRLLRRPWRIAGRGCHLDRDPRAALAARGWEVSAIADLRLPLPAPARPGQVGVARPPSAERQPSSRAGSSKSGNSRSVSRK